MNIKLNKSEAGQPAQNIINEDLDIETIEAILNDSLSNETQQADLKARFGNGLYRAIARYLTNIDIKTEDQASELCRAVAEHRSALNTSLGRDPGLEVAALDYCKNIKNYISQPAVIEKKEIDKIARDSIKDELTDTFNNRVLKGDFDYEQARVERYGKPCSLLFADLDGFKALNDQAGHLAGDKALRKVAMILKDNVRQTDTVYRYGGDEFVVLMPETGLNDAVTAVDKIKDAVHRQVAGSDGKLSLSCGVASYDGNNFNTINECLDAADQALLNAKQSGKNRLYVYHNQNRIEDAHNPKPVSESKQIEKAQRQVIDGKTIVSGAAVGRSFLYRDMLSREMEIYDISPDDIDSEMERINNAFSAVQADLQRMEEVVHDEFGRDQAAIFSAHQTILKDAAFLLEIEQELETRLVNSEAVVKEIFHRLFRKFRSFEREEFQQRVYDIEDLLKRILRELQGIDHHALAEVPENSVLFARRLLPSDTVHLKQRNAAAIVTAEGSATSHAGILARSLDIPFISCMDTELIDIPHDVPVIVEGNKEHVILNPSEQELDEFRAEIAEIETETHKREIIQIEQKVEYAGEKVLFFANISSLEEAQEAARQNCDGIGLFRIENIYLARNSLISESELVAELKRILEPVKDREITIRLLDIGGDKQLPYLNLPRERNAQLGLRGIRLLFEYPDLLDTQLSACLQLAEEYAVRIMIPMVSLVSDLTCVSERYEEICRESGCSDPPPLGLMIETPAAVLTLPELMETSAFFSIGTNDLSQYVMAACREQYNISRYLEKGAGIILQLVSRILSTIGPDNQRCDLCGEMGGDLEYTIDLLEAGLRHFSVAPHRIPLLKEHIYNLTLA